MMRKKTLYLMVAGIIVAAAASPAAQADENKTIDQIELGSCLVYPDIKKLTVDDISIARPTADEISTDLTFNTRRLDLDPDPKLPFLNYRDYYTDGKDDEIWADVSLNGEYDFDYVKRTQYLLVIRQIGAPPVQTQITKEIPLKQAFTSTRTFSILLGTRVAKDGAAFPDQLQNFDLNGKTEQLMSGIQQKSDLIVQDIQTQIARMISETSVELCK